MDVLLLGDADSLASPAKSNGERQTKTGVSGEGS